MISKIIGATALLLTAITAQAQGGVSPVTTIPSTAEVSVPPPVPADSVPSPQGFNPFQPPQPAPEPTVDLDAPPPVDPVIAAIAKELQEIREKGERLGTVDGKTIFRYEGHYLIEAINPDAASTGPAIDPEKRKAALAGECVIRVITDTTHARTAVVQTAEPKKTH